jgi:hypothetical protein
MSRDANGFLGAVVRLAIWIVPSHRKDWAQAMLNECAYIESRREAVRWIVESALFAIKERTIYELEKASMNLRAFKTALVLIAAAVSFVAGIYAIQKPYQQERIKFALCRLLDAKQT